jgi:type VI secretion system secreted protein Hcp
MSDATAFENLRQRVFPAGGSSAATMVDYFLKIERIPGESQDAKHKDEIQLLSWNWGEEQAGTHHFGGGGGAGRVHMRDFHFTMNINKASPKLMLACATGDHIPKAVLTARKAGKDQQEYLKITFEDLLVSLYETGSDATVNGLPVDSVGLNFSRIVIEYKVQNADGTLGSGTRVGYDVRTLKSF